MTINFSDELILDFQMPQKWGDPVIVRRCLPDNTTVPIGRIYQNISDDDEGTVTYATINKNGEAICSPTSDWIAVENSFKDYAKELARTEREESYIKEAERKEEIKSIRTRKQQLTINR